MLTKRQHIINRKIIMLQTGKNIPAIARKLKMSRPAIHMTITGERTNKKTQLAICKILKVSPEVFWPDFFRRGAPSYDATLPEGITAVN